MFFPSEREREREREGEGDGGGEKEIFSLLFAYIIQTEIVFSILILVQLMHVKA